jgi:hypothetical protein
MIAAVGPRPAGVRPEPSSEPIGAFPAALPVGSSPQTLPVPVAEEHQRVEGIVKPDSGLAASRSLADHVVDAIRPTLSNPSLGRPAAIRQALERFDQALCRLCADPAQQDQLLETARLVLAEERLRVEVLRQRLQMALKG